MILVNAVMGWIESERLMGRGIGFIDAHLLYSTLHRSGTRLWTADKGFGESRAVGPFTPKRGSATRGWFAGPGNWMKEWCCRTVKVLLVAATPLTSLPGRSLVNVGIASTSVFSGSARASRTARALAVLSVIARNSSLGSTSSTRGPMRRAPKTCVPRNCPGYGETERRAGGAQAGRTYVTSRRSKPAQTSALSNPHMKRLGQG